MPATTLERSTEFTPSFEQHEYRQPTLEELAARSALMRHADIPVVELEKVGKVDAANVWQEYVRADVNVPGKSFKARGAFYAVLQARERGVTDFVTASAGNHAQGIAHAVSLLDGKATIFVPNTTPQTKLDGIRGLGEKHIELNDDAESFEKAQILAQNYDAEYISPYDNYDVIAGQGTVAYEALCERPETDVIFVQVGGAGFLAGTLETVDVMKQAGLVKQSLVVVAVMYEGNDSLANTMKNDGRPTPASNPDSLPEGSAVERPGELSAGMTWRYREHLEMMIVNKDDLAEALVAAETRRDDSVKPYPIPEVTGLLAPAAARKRAKQRSIQGTAPEHWLAMITGSNSDNAKTQELKAHYDSMEQERLYPDTLYHDMGNRACVAAGGKISVLS